MKWVKLGNIFNVTGTNSFLRSHATNPLPIQIDENTFRIFFSSRNDENKSSVSYVDFDIIKRKCKSFCNTPVHTFGDDSSFLSHGISIGCNYTTNNDNFILFMAWQIPKGEHWRGKIGRFHLINNNILILNPQIPFIEFTEDEISLSYPFVLFEDGIFKMWYGATLSWSSVNDEMIHPIMYATSTDGFNWEKKGIAIPYEIGVAQAFSRPTVIRDDMGYHMWYSYRSGDGTSYRIGYSHSLDGLKWIRKHEEVGINISETGWDSEMICYPYVFIYKGECYMLYNGNDYGKTGFGLAKLSKL